MGINDGGIVHIPESGGGGGGFDLPVVVGGTEFNWLSSHTSIDLDLPGNIKPGDTIIAGFMLRTEITSGLDGWTEIGRQDNEPGSQEVRLYRKTAVSGDAGKTYTFTLNPTQGTRAWCGAIVVRKNEPVLFDDVLSGYGETISWGPELNAIYLPEVDVGGEALVITLISRSIAGVKNDTYYFMKRFDPAFYSGPVVKEKTKAIDAVIRAVMSAEYARGDDVLFDWQTDVNGHVLDVQSTAYMILILR